MIISDIMIWAMVLALLGALGTTAYSVYHSRRTNKRQAMENGVPVGRIDWAVIALLVVVAVPSCIVGSFTDACLITAFVMLAVAAAVIVYDKLKKRSVQTQKTT